MILCTVGMHNQGFNRLVQPMDVLASQVDEKVIIQYGACTYIPLHANHFQYISSEHMEHLTREARVVVAHAAAGSIILAMRLGKPLVVVPRLKRFGEHFDDHQLQLANILAKQKFAVIVNNPGVASLMESINNSSNVPRASSEHNKLLRSLNRQLEEWG